MRKHIKKYKQSGPSHIFTRNGSVHAQKIPLGRRRGYQSFGRPRLWSSGLGPSQAPGISCMGLVEHLFFKKEWAEDICLLFGCSNQHVDQNFMIQTLQRFCCWSLVKKRWLVTTCWRCCAKAWIHQWFAGGWGRTWQTKCFFFQILLPPASISCRQKPCEWRNSQAQWPYISEWFNDIMRKSCEPALQALMPPGITIEFGDAGHNSFEIVPHVFIQDQLGR